MKPAYDHKQARQPGPQAQSPTAPVQAKADLRGMDYAAQVAALSPTNAAARLAPEAPVQMTNPGKSGAAALPGKCTKKKPPKLNTGQQAGGFTFKNKEGLLPADASGAPITYTEYDVNPYDGAQRDAERVVMGSDGRVWYTDDHYASFTEVK